MSVARRLSEWLPLLWFLVACFFLAGLWASGIVASLLRRLTKFGGFGVTFELTAESARQTRESVQSNLAEVRKTVTSKLMGDTRSANLAEVFRAIMESMPYLHGTEYRATIHVQDPLFANQLVQLLDYFPRGLGAGRTFSVRTGIIGMAWRNREPDAWYQGSGVTVKDLMRKWGMTPEEADQRMAADSRKLFLAHPLEDASGARIAVFFLDAKDHDAVGLSPELTGDQATEAAEKRLSDIGSAFAERFRQQMLPRLALLLADTAKSSPLLGLEGT